MAGGLYICMFVIKKYPILSKITVKVTSNQLAELHFKCHKLLTMFGIVVSQDLIHTRSLCEFAAT